MDFNKMLNEKVYFKKTNFKGLDKLYNEAKNIEKEISSMKDQVEKATKKMLKATDFSQIKHASIHHAIVGLVFLLSARAKGNPPEGSYEILEEAPFIRFNNDLIEEDKDEKIAEEINGKLRLK